MLYDCEESLTKPQNEGGCRPPEKLVMGPIKSKIVIWEKFICSPELKNAGFTIIENK
jgi:hypothetical protein